MPQKFVMDIPGGDSMLVHVADEVSGYSVPPFHEEAKQQKIFDNLPNFKCRNDDVIILSYPKTGLHWVLEMLNIVFTNTGTPVGPSMIEALPQDRFDAMPSPRVFSTHVSVQYLPEDIKQKSKCILLVRNPKDTVVSFYNHMLGISLQKYSGKFVNFLQMFMRDDATYGSYPKYLKGWQQFMRDNTNHSILVVYYEDLKKNCLGELKKMCNHFGKVIDNGRLQEIVDNCDIDKMRKRDAEKWTEEMKKRLRNDFSFFRKGQIGDWKNWFTVAQNEMFDQWWKNETRDIDMFTFKYSEEA